MEIEKQAARTLLFNDECGVCRSIANWVRKSAGTRSDLPEIIVRPIGQDPEKLRTLNPDLNIWDAYSTIHMLMPDGSMKLGGEAVAEVLRDLPSTRWFTWLFAIPVFGLRPFQSMLNLAYAILADVRPVFGCESCGTPSPWILPIRWMVKEAALVFGKNRHPDPRPHFTPLATSSSSPQARRI
jgi:predicted DCC family thiol-disulfide oxidoreductase YuxK